MPTLSGIGPNASYTAQQEKGVGGGGNCLANATFSLRAEAGKTKARAMNFVFLSREETVQQTQRQTVGQTVETVSAVGKIQKKWACACAPT